MAAEAVILPRDRDVAGRRIIEMTDSVGFDATGAGWGFTKATETWRFYLFTTMADTKGPLWIWERLVKAFSRLPLPEGITPLDIVVASPNEALYRSFPVKLATGTLGVGARADVGGSGEGDGDPQDIDIFWLLRSRPEAALVRSMARRDNAARRFDMKVRQLLAV